MSQRDLFQAFADADSGMRQAIVHANQASTHWGDVAYDYLVSFARRTALFISEDVSDASKESGIPQPPTDRAWGAVYRRAIKDGVIIQDGTGRSRRRHASICPQWKSLVLSTKPEPKPELPKNGMLFDVSPDASRM